MPTNRELLIARNKMRRGLPTSLVETGIDTSRRTGRGIPKTTGTQGIEAREAAATLEEFPGVATGIKGTGANIAKRFAGLRPTSKKSGVPEPTAVERITSAEAKGLPGVSKKAGRPTLDFGLPTDRMPSIGELGATIGQMFKYIGQMSKFNKARGLTPGVEVTKRNTGLTKARLNTLTKLHETATLAGDTDKASKIEDQLNAIMYGDIGAGAIDTDIDEIENL